MRCVTLRDKIAGERLAMPIHGDGGRLLLSAGVYLTPPLIQSLRKRGYTRVAIEDSLFSDVEPDLVIRDETRQMTVQALSIATANAVSGGADYVGPLNAAVDAIIDDLLANPKACVGLYSLCSFDEETYTHSINATVLALAASQEVGWNSQSQKQLGMGALLHDIGKVLIPPSILHKPGPFTDDEYTLVKTHAEKGWELLRTCYPIGPIAAHAALDHHERCDGSGYPRSLKGYEIGDIGRMTAVADVYEAMTADRPQRRALLPQNVRDYLFEQRGVLFDGEYVEAMFQRVLMYPSGTIVSLWGGYVGVVVKQDPRCNARPNVRIVSGPGVTKPTDVALYERPDLNVHMILDDYPPETRRVVHSGGLPQTPPTTRDIVEQYAAAWRNQGDGG